MFLIVLAMRASRTQQTLRSLSVDTPLYLIRWYHIDLFMGARVNDCEYRMMRMYDAEYRGMQLSQCLRTSLQISQSNKFGKGGKVEGLRGPGRIDYTRIE